MQQQSLRITPSILEFHDFVDGTCVSKTVSVQNISPRRLKVAMEAPKSLFFSIVDLHKKTDVVLAPGISVDITVEFRFNKPKNNNTVSVTGVQDGERDYPTEITDYVRFTAGKSDETILQLSALPAVPKICVDSVIDFGTILLPSRSSSQDSSINASPKVFTKYIKIRNEGLVPTTLQVVLDDSPSIQVTPMTLSLPAAKRSEAYETLKVDFRPSSAGVFNGKILLAINQSAASKSHQNPAAVINICAEVLDKQLHLRQSGSSKEIDDCNIDFGALYRGESSKFFVNVVNNGPAALRWVSFNQTLLLLYFDSIEISRW